MALVTCRECGGTVSSEAQNCPSCGVRVKPKAKIWRWVFGVPVALFALVMAIGAMNSNPEKNQARRAYEMCQDSLASADRARNGTASFVAGTCEKMRQDFVNKYGVNP
ncbi:MAG: hypothetical protein M9929_04185 [Burkholderiaceae bacterium]|nr:hypothetical protein [Burkholderiaceae bacterium]